MQETHKSIKGTMNEDKPSQEFHVTPRGWISGTCREFGVVCGQPVDRPADAVETWLEEMVIPYPQCADVYSWRMIWYDPTLTETERMQIRKQFPKPSDDFPD